MDLEALAIKVRCHFQEHAARYGLHAEDVQADYSLNWGGFVNAHFDVGDGQRSYHLKLARDPDSALDLRRWRNLAPLLETRYRAPRVIDRIKIEGTPFEGLLFEKSSGRPPDFASCPSLAGQMVDLLNTLHHDHELEKALLIEGVDGDARGSVLERYIDCFETDLGEFGGRYPVTGEALEWMRQETSRLRSFLEAEVAFDQVRSVPIHSDPWEENILVEPSGRWLVLDWDGLALGDPVLDYAVFLWPLVRDGSDPSRWLGAKASGEPFMARFRLCLRANLLDEVIDSLADWVEAEAAPEHVERVREKKLQIHRRAFIAYQAKYG